MHEKIFLAKTLIDSSGLCHFFDINASQAIFIPEIKLNKARKLRKLSDIYFCALYYIFDVIVCVCLNVCIYICVCSYSYYNTTKVNLECLINQDVKVDYRTKWLNAIFYFILLCEALEQKQE